MPGALNVTGADLGEGVEVQEERCGGLLHVFGPLLAVDLLSFLALLRVGSR